jgi:hypothetical protein
MAHKIDAALMMLLACFVLPSCLDQQTMNAHTVVNGCLLSFLSNPIDEKA